MLWLGSQHPGFKVDTGVVRDRGAYLHQNNVAVAQLRDYPEARLRKQLAVVVLALIPPAVLAVVAAKVNAHLTLVEVKNDTQAVMHPMDELTPDQIGRASCRERVSRSGRDGSLKETGAQ